MMSEEFEAELLEEDVDFDVDTTNLEEDDLEEDDDFDGDDYSDYDLAEWREQRQAEYDEANPEPLYYASYADY